MTTLKRIEDNIIGKKYKPGIEFHFIVAVPETEVSEYALLVEHDGENEVNVNSMFALAEEGIYRRELCADCTRFENPQRKFISYYD